MMNIRKLEHPPLILLLIILFVAAGQISLYLYSPALPIIAHELGISTSDSQMTMSAFLLTFGLSQLLYGPLSDYYGRLPVILTGLSLLILGALLAVFSHSFDMLCLARLIQGGGAGAVSALARATTRDCFDGDKLKRAFSYLSMAIAVTPIICPFLGGIILEFFTWHMIFILLVAYGLILGTFIYLYLPETNKHLKQTSIKPIHVLKSYAELLRHKKALLYIFCQFISYSCVTAYLTITPFTFEQHLNFSPGQYGALILISTSGYILGAFLSARFSHRFSVNTLIIIGTLITLSAGLILVFQNHIPLFSLTVKSVAILTMGLMGVGFIRPNASAGLMQPFPHKAGIAAALNGFIQMTGSGLSAAAIAYLQLTHIRDLGFYFIIANLLILSAFLLLKLILKAHPHQKI